MPRTLLPHSATVLRHAARIGDLREAGLGGSREAAACRAWDGVRDEAAVHHALKLCCWMNTVERRRFSPPYVDKDADAKHAFFRDHLAAALTEEGVEALRQGNHQIVEFSYQKTKNYERECLCARVCMCMGGGQWAAWVVHSCAWGNLASLCSVLSVLPVGSTGGSGG